MYISANQNIFYLSNLQTDQTVWIWVALALALIALLCSLAALRRSKQRSEPDHIEMPAVTSSSSVADGTLDPAIIAVLTATVAMMLSETSAVNPARPVSAAQSPAGFTIRTIRRV